MVREKKMKNFAVFLLVFSGVSGLRFHIDEESPPDTEVGRIPGPLTSRTALMNHQDVFRARSRHGSAPDADPHRPGHVAARFLRLVHRQSRRVGLSGPGDRGGRRRQWQCPVLPGGRRGQGFLGDGPDWSAGVAGCGDGRGSRREWPCAELWDCAGEWSRWLPASFDG